MMKAKHFFIIFLLVFTLLLSSLSFSFVGNSSNYSINSNPSTVVVSGNNSNYDFDSFQLIPITGSSANYFVGLIPQFEEEVVEETTSSSSSSGGSSAFSSLFGGDVADSPITKSASKGQTITFQLNGTYYHLDVDSVEENKIFLDFVEGSSFLEIYVNSSKNLDVNGDNSPDVIVSLDEIKESVVWERVIYRGVVTVELFSIETPESKVVSSSPESETVSNPVKDSSDSISGNVATQPKKTTSETSNSTTEISDSPEKSSSSSKSVVYIFVFIIVLGGIGAFLFVKVIPRHHHHDIVPHTHPDEIPKVSEDKSQPKIESSLTENKIEDEPVVSSNQLLTSEEKIKQFASKMHDLGKSDEIIKKALLSVGWKPELIDRYLSKGNHVSNKFNPDSVNKLVRFIIEERKLGITDDLTKQKLIGVGWRTDLVEYSFSQC